MAGGDTCGFAAKQLGIFALQMVIPVAPGAPLCRASSDAARFDGLEISLKGGQNGTAEILHTNLERESIGGNMALKIALMGAGGKMGCRITDNIKDLADYDVRYVEVSPAGLANLAQRGLTATPQAEAVADADAVVLAVPDRLIGKITTDLVPQLRPGAMLIGLDPAAAYAGVMPLRERSHLLRRTPLPPDAVQRRHRPQENKRLVRRNLRLAARRLRAVPRAGGGLRDRRSAVHRDVRQPLWPRVWARTG